MYNLFGGLKICQKFPHSLSGWSYADLPEILYTIGIGTSSWPWHEFECSTITNKKAATPCAGHSPGGLDVFSRGRLCTVACFCLHDGHCELLASAMQGLQKMWEHVGVWTAVSLSTSSRQTAQVNSDSSSLGSSSCSAGSPISPSLYLAYCKLSDVAYHSVVYLQVYLWMVSCMCITQLHVLDTLLCLCTCTRKRHPPSPLLHQDLLSTPAPVPRCCELNVELLLQPKWFWSTRKTLGKLLVGSGASG